MLYAEYFTVQLRLNSNNTNVFIYSNTHKGIQLICESFKYTHIYNKVQFLILQYRELSICLFQSRYIRNNLSPPVRQLVKNRTASCDCETIDNVIKYLNTLLELLLYG